MVFAYTIGQTITQEQFDNIDFSKISHDFTLVGFEKSPVNLKFYINWTTLKENIDGEWKVVQLTHTESYQTSKYILCRATNSKETCVQIVKDEIKERIKIKNKLHNRWLENQKTAEVYSEIDENDFIFNLE